MFLANRKYILLSYKHSISETISLLYQERKLINFLLEQAGERLIFSQNELLRFGRNNPESLQRLFQVGILYGQKDTTYLNQAFFSWAKLPDSLTQGNLWELHLDHLDQLLEIPHLTHPEIREVKVILQSVKEISFDQAELILLGSDKQTAWDFHLKVRELIQKIVLAAGKSTQEDELQLLVWQVLHTLKSISQTLLTFYKQAHTDFHRKLKRIKQLKDQGNLDRNSKEIQYIEEESSLFFEPTQSAKLILSPRQLAGEKISNLLKLKKGLGNITKTARSKPADEGSLQMFEKEKLDLLELKEAFEATKQDLYSFLSEQESLKEHAGEGIREYFFLLSQSFGANWKWKGGNIQTEAGDFPKVYAK
ncbi:MAG: hypothetical protein AAF696_13630 [Bacteroidota bacterium]